MAINFFQRLANLWRGFISLWISDIEKEHPEIAYENSINKMVEKYAQLKQATAAIIRRREDVERRLKDTKRKLEQVEADLNAAVETNQDEVALVLINQKNTLEMELNDLQQEFEIALKDSEEAKASILNIQAEINKLKSEKERMIAKMASAQARIKVQEQLSGLSVDAEIKALENVRKHIGDIVAQANLGSELESATLDAKLAKIRQQSGDITAKKQLEELKAAMAAKKAGQKSM